MYGQNGEYAHAHAPVRNKQNEGVEQAKVYMNKK